jgi:hypothetical protein
MTRIWTHSLFLVTLTDAGLAPIIHDGPIINQTFSGSFPANITGTLPAQDTALLEMFTLPSTSDVTVTSTSYASGGFEPNLLLFNSTGNFLNSGIPFGQPDPNTGIIGDMRLTASGLPAGMYTLVVTDFLLNQSLTATNLSDGFTVNYGSGTTFTDSNGNQRSGNFALTIYLAYGLKANVNSGGFFPEGVNGVLNMSSGPATAANLS